ncbi:hypothetical protein ZYGM_002530 [Zygosaccharomyces mellis]|uniref:Uncharacterized protein n=1 Tax=Zygosaccharomyces mellis TaxID=42258 RepID=A0A4C2E4G5_9SACH|nr:hypothetical protein ZYGM_002530 [Zygosaccharomyces mellis]
MRHEWTLFELHRLIFLEEKFTELRDLFGPNLTLDTMVVNEHTTRLDLLLENNEDTSRFIIFRNPKIQVPMVLCFTGENQLIQLLSCWLKSQGVIVLPITLNPQAMLNMADSIRGLQFYDTKLIFDVNTTDKNLKKLELEVDKESFKLLTADLSSHTALRDKIVPYIYQQSGIITEKMPLTMISFAGAASITHNKIITSSWRNDTLEELLNLIQ